MVSQQAGTNGAMHLISWKAAISAQKFYATMEPFGLKSCPVGEYDIKWFLEPENAARFVQGLEQEMQVVAPTKESPQHLDLYRLKDEWLVKSDSKESCFRTSVLRADEGDVDVQIFSTDGINKLAGGYSYSPERDELRLFFVMPGYLKTSAAEVLLADMRQRALKSDPDRVFSDGEYSGTTMDWYRAALGLTGKIQVYDMTGFTSAAKPNGNLVNDADRRHRTRSEYRKSRTDI